MKRVAIIGTNGIPAKYGGFETLAHYLTRELGEKCNFTVYCSSIYTKEERKKELHHAKLIYLPLKANKSHSMLYDAVTSLHAFFTSDVLLILGPAFGFVLALNVIFRKKIIVNHGGLNEWEREKLTPTQKKYAYLSHKVAGKYADFNIADNKPLGNSLKSTFGIEAEIIEYGGDHVERISPDEADISLYPFLGLEYDLSVSRAQIDNNLHLLLEAYEAMTFRNLVIISNWHVTEYGKALKEKYLDKFSHIFIVDAVYDIRMLDIIRSNCRLYIHSHSQCGTAPSLVEAMNYNIPVVCFDVPTNRATTLDQTQYFSNVDELKSLVQSLDENHLEENRSKMFAIAREKYTWAKISDKYLKLINVL